MVAGSNRLSTKIRKIILLIGFVSQSVFAQSSNIPLWDLAGDSWQDRHKVFKPGWFFSGDRLAYTGAGLMAVSIAFVNDGRWQNALYDPAYQQRWFLQNIAEPFGNPYVVAPLLIANHELARILGKRSWQTASQKAFSSMAWAATITFSLKLATHRQRPAEALNPDPYRFDGPSFRLQNLSFPSGHTTIAFATAVSLSLSLDRWYYTIPLLTLASATGYQRVVAGKHWPSDVFLGALIGSGVAYSVHRAPRQEGRLKAMLLPLGQGGLLFALNWQFN